jgi:hypothetical protein
LWLQRGRFAAQTERDMISYTLHYANARSPVVRVVPHNIYADMWLMVWPDGQLSDLGNLSRIKDAAEVIFARGRDSALLHWKQHPYEKPVEAPYSDLSEREAA